VEGAIPIYPGKQRAKPLHQSGPGVAELETDIKNRIADTEDLQD